MKKDKTFHLPFQEIARMIVPDEILESFDVVKVENKQSEWVVYLEEKPELIPDELKNTDYVLNGFMNPIELTTYPAKGKIVYLHIKRRRWKEKGGNKGYNNEYCFNYEGVKATKEFADFLKELDRK